MDGGLLGLRRCCIELSQMAEGSVLRHYSREIRQTDTGSGVQPGWCVAWVREKEWEGGIYPVAASCYRCDLCMNAVRGLGTCVPRLVYPQMVLETRGEGVVGTEEALYG